MDCFFQCAIGKSLSHTQMLSEPLWTPGNIVADTGTGPVMKSLGSALVKRMGFPQRTENRCPNKSL